MRSATVTIAGLLVANGALALLLSMSDAPERPQHTSSEPVTVHLSDGWVAYQSSLSRRSDGAWVMPSALAWTNAFESEVPGPTGEAPVSVDVEAAPSPQHPGATLLRVLVQGDRRARRPLKDVQLRLDFFPFEVAAWRAPEQPWWEAPSTPLLATIDLPAAATRVLFVEVDARLRFGASLGVATFTATEEDGRAVRLVAPLERGHRDLDDASLDFRFFAAVFIAAETHLGTRVNFETLDALLADSTTGQPAREAFATDGLRRVESGLVHTRTVDWSALGY